MGVYKSWRVWWGSLSFGEVKSLEGIVKRWLDRGYGFIGVEGQEDDIFVHHTAIDVFELREGQRVEFDLEDSEKGPRAVNVKVLE